MSERLALGQLHALGLVFLAEIRGMLRDQGEMERRSRSPSPAAPGNLTSRAVAGPARAPCWRLLDGDHPAALAAFERGISLPAPAARRRATDLPGLCALLLAAEGDRVGRQIQDAAGGMDVNRAKPRPARLCRAHPGRAAR